MITCIEDFALKTLFQVVEIKGTGGGTETMRNQANNFVVVHTYCVCWLSTRKLIIICFHITRPETWICSIQSDRFELGQFNVSLSFDNFVHWNHKYLIENSCKAFA